MIGHKKCYVSAMMAKILCMRDISKKERNVIMKKYLSVLFVVLGVMAIFASTVLAAPASKNASLLSVSYNEGGVVLMFQTSGLSRADLKDASIYVASNWYKMYCQFVDETTKVRCTVDKKWAGMGSFKAVLAGLGFWGELPQKRPVCSVGETPWYAYDEYHNGLLVFSGKVPVWVWEQAVTNGFFDVLEKNGYTFEITGTFCGSNI